MKLITAIAVATALVGTQASAQGVDLTGRYRCVQYCQLGFEAQPAFVTQNGWNMNILNEAGAPSRAWIDWPGHIWVQSWYEGAVYSPDGMTIQFDRGAVWQRDLGEPYALAPERSVVQPPAVRRSDIPAARPAARPPAVAHPHAGPAAAIRAFDGDWSVVIMTERGGCDRAYRYGVQIVDGHVLASGGEAVNLQGQVLPDGSVRVSVSAGGQQADGEGRLSRNVGTGTWRGQGAGGTCSGIWQAERRG
jgi:hypothetical protein